MVWILSISVSLVCSYFVMLYGLKYGYQRSTEWLVSWFTGFFQSVLITQPLKVIIIVVIFTYIFRRPVTIKEQVDQVKLSKYYT